MIDELELSVDFAAMTDLEISDLLLGLSSDLNTNLVLRGALIETVYRLRRSGFGSRTHSVNDLTPDGIYPERPPCPKCSSTASLATSKSSRSGTRR